MNSDSSISNSLTPDSSVPEIYISTAKEKQTHQSHELNELVAAFAKASIEMESAFKDKSNSFLKYSYCSLEQMIDVTRPVLGKHGLCVFQPVIDMGSYHIIYTKLYHSSSQWIGSTIRINPGKDGDQAFGTSVTYMRRYAYVALLGISFKDESDDDGEKNAGRSTQTQPQKQKSTYVKPAKLITAEQLTELEYELDGYDDIKDMLLKALDITSLDKMHKSVYADSIDMVRFKKEELLVFQSGKRLKTN